jgi:hypothetical protein
MPFRRDNACRLGAFAAVLPLLWLATFQPGRAAAPTAGALGEAARWVAAKFGGSVEWTLYFKNTGTGDTPILADILALDARFHRPGRGEFVLQGHTYGLSLWLPFQGTGTGSGAISPYLLRSTLVTHFTACFDVRRPDLDYDLIRRVLGQWKQYAPYYFGDYYPLTAYSLDETAWMAWQFDAPEKSEGVVQAFRRAESVYEVARFKLRGLEPGTRYVLANLDSGESQTLSGRELLDRGLAVSITDQPGSAAITYGKAK